MTILPSKPPGIFKNWLSLFGAIISTGGLFAFLFLTAMDMFQQHGNPYMGILAYVIAPGFIFLGVLLALIGALMHRRRLRAAGEEALVPSISIDLSRPRDRKVLACFVVGGMFFLMLTSLGSYQTYHYTESVGFCGKTCHTPMKPENVAFEHSPHARVECVQCHVGSGAGAYVQAKMRGVHQLVAMITGDYSRPIKTPIHTMRSPQEICRHCHWPEKFKGNKDKMYTHFLADETNTAFSVRLSLKLGGGDPNDGPVPGIHWHTSSKVEYYASDDRLQTIPWVRYTDRDGKVIEYRTPDFKDQAPPGKIQTMDCTDCHNRPAHQFHPPNDSVDKAMEEGKIDATLPWVKSNIVAALIAPYSTEDEALQKIGNDLKAKYPANPKIDSAIAAAKKIYQNNFFPEMKADWRAYPNNIGHKQWAGCFRCHDGNHKSSDARTIRANDCNMCHTILAQGAGAQLDQLSAKGHSFFHIDAVNEDFSCNNCHTGAFPKE